VDGLEEGGEEDAPPEHAEMDSARSERQAIRAMRLHGSINSSWAGLERSAIKMWVHGVVLD
jgi:hypothetical protein